MFKQTFVFLSPIHCNGQYSAKHVCRLIVFNYRTGSRPAAIFCNILQYSAIFVQHLAIFCNFLQNCAIFSKIVLLSAILCNSTGTPFFVDGVRFILTAKKCSY